MALRFRKAQINIYFAPLLMLLVTPLWAQDTPANTAATAVDGAPVEEAPVPQPSNGRLVYKSVDSKGKVTFTDTAPIGRPSEAIVVQSANTMPVGSPSAATSGQGNTANKPVQVKYSVLVITSPANDELFGQDVEAVVLTAQLEPSLQEGNTFQLYYDGKPVGDGGMSYTVTELERGTHTVEAKVFNSKKQLLKAASPVQFTVRRISAVNNVTVAQPAKNGKPADPAPPMSGFSGPKGAGGSGGSKSAGDAGSLGGAGSSDGANSPAGPGLRTKK